jgi:hypothetical protein
MWENRENWTQPCLNYIYIFFLNSSIAFEFAEKVQLSRMTKKTALSQNRACLWRRNVWEWLWLCRLPHIITLIRSSWVKADDGPSSCHASPPFEFSQRGKLLTLWQEVCDKVLRRSHTQGCHMWMCLLEDTRHTCFPRDCFFLQNCNKVCDAREMMIRRKTKEVLFCHFSLDSSYWWVEEVGFTDIVILKYVSTTREQNFVSPELFCNSHGEVEKNFLKARVNFHLMCTFSSCASASLFPSLFCDVLVESE